MKICAVVAEYNPLHLGHIKHIEYMKNVLNAEHVLVIMSGNFTQRGEPAILNKFTRARQAVLAGADAVIELPTVFATANAEIFAKGAMKILDSLGVADGLCFGVESGTAEDFSDLAMKFTNETKEFKKLLKARLSEGVSLAKARFSAIKELYGEDVDEELILKPNNILGLEYTKALISLKSDVKIYPMLREGDHNDAVLKKGITSATSIRLAVKEGKLKKLKKNLPPYTYKDLKEYPNAFDKMILSALYRASKEELSEIPDCTEGLENRIKALITGSDNIEELIEKISTKRYTAARIRRIFTANLLGINKDLINDCLTSPLYAKVLAVNSSNKNIISELNKNGNIPVITRKSDALRLKGTARVCYEKDALANDLYNLAADENFNQNYTVMV